MVGALEVVLVLRREVLVLRRVRLVRAQLLLQCLCWECYRCGRSCSNVRQRFGTCWSRSLPARYSSWMHPLQEGSEPTMVLFLAPADLVTKLS